MELRISKIEFCTSDPEVNSPITLRFDRYYFNMGQPEVRSSFDWLRYPIAFSTDPREPRTNTVVFEITLENLGDTEITGQLQADGGSDPQNATGDRYTILSGTEYHEFTAPPHSKTICKLPISQVDLAGRGVAVHNAEWSWRVKVDGVETEFGITKFTIYALLRQPQKPWVQAPISSPELPWISILDFACRWATGARTVAEAADAICAQVYALGRASYPIQGSRRKTFLTYILSQAFEYQPFFHTPTRELFPEIYSFDRLLARLGAKDLAEGGVDCRDCAMLVSTLVNILGGDFDQLVLSAEKPFMTNDILLIGSPPDQWIKTDFDRHEVAGHRDCRSGLIQIWDACLAIDVSDSPCTTHQPQLPMGKPIGSRYDPQSYLARLVASGDLDVKITSEGRRRLIPSDSHSATPTELKRLFPKGTRARKRWPYRESGSIDVRSAIASLSLSLADEWQFERSEDVTRRPQNVAIKGYWLRPAELAFTDRVSLTLIDCESHRWAHDFLWQMLQRSYVSLTRLKDPNRIGDVAFSDGVTNTLATSGNLFIQLAFHGEVATGRTSLQEFTTVVIAELMKLL